MDGGAWQTIVHGVAKSQKLLINSEQHSTCRLIISGVLCFPGSSVDKECACNAGDQGLIPGLGRSPRKWPPTPGFLPGKSHGQRSLAGYSP